MTQISRPWAGIVTGDSGPYSHEEWAEIWRNLLGFGATTGDVGPVKGTGNGTYESLWVRSNATANVIVAPGSALVRGIGYINSADVTLAIAANASGNARIDTVALSADFTAQTVRLVVRQGTPAASPVAPTLTQTDGVQWDIPLADVAVANGFVSIAQGDITPRTHWTNAADGVYLDNVLNNSGALLQTGDVVIVDTTTSRAVTTTTTVNNSLIAGVVVGRIAAGAAGRIQVAGIGLVRTTAAISSRNTPLITSGTARSAVAVTTDQTYAFAHSLETTSGAGLCLARINVPGPKVGIPFAVLEEQQAQNTAGGSSTATTWTTRTLNTEVVDANNIVALAANQFTPIAGTYRITAASPLRAAAGNTARIRLRNATQASVVIVSPNYPLGDAVAKIHYTFVANGTDAFEIQYYVTASLATSGLGLAVNEGSAVERYTRVVLEKIA